MTHKYLYQIRSEDADLLQQTHKYFILMMVSAVKVTLCSSYEAFRSAMLTEEPGEGGRSNMSGNTTLAPFQAAC